jgi:hypothetical protein
MKFASHTQGTWPGINGNFFKTEEERREEALQLPELQTEKTI